MTTASKAPRWVACSTREFGPSGAQRHLAHPGALDTLCGFSASYPAIWRGNTTKPKCSACERIEATLPVTPGHPDGIRLPYAAERALVDAVAEIADAKHRASTNTEGGRA